LCGRIKSEKRKGKKKRLLPHQPALKAAWGRIRRLEPYLHHHSLDHMWIEVMAEHKLRHLLISHKDDSKHEWRVNPAKNLLCLILNRLLQMRKARVQEEAVVEVEYNLSALLGPHNLFRFLTISLWNIRRHLDRYHLESQR
jgi:hypothetical protein